MEIVKAGIREVEVEKTRTIQETYTEIEEQTVMLVELTEKDISSLDYHPGLRYDSSCYKMITQLSRAFSEKEFELHRPVKQVVVKEDTKKINWLAKWEKDPTSWET